MAVFLRQVFIESCHSPALGRSATASTILGYRGVRLRLHGILLEGCVASEKRMFAEPKPTYCFTKERRAGKQVCSLGGRPRIRPSRKAIVPRLSVAVQRIVCRRATRRHRIDAASFESGVCKRNRQGARPKGDITFYILRRLQALPDAQGSERGWLRMQLMQNSLSIEERLILGFHWRNIQARLVCYCKNEIDACMEMCF